MLEGYSVFVLHAYHYRSLLLQLQTRFFKEINIFFCII
ncbi:hypothetical protein yaldo0001_17350 [Yersinia aldovae ATCC 35236]|nr:hypothetical protein yaldo0001_17350 [Yersinia aldovae ATCC 35236]